MLENILKLSGIVCVGGALGAVYWPLGVAFAGLVLIGMGVTVRGRTR